MHRSRIALAAAAAVTAALALLLGGALREPLSASAGSSPQIGADRLQAGFSAGDTAGLVRRLQRELRANPDHVRSNALLGVAYQQRARETGDATYYTKSEGVLRRALAVTPDDLLATSALGSLALSRHRFREALRLGERARSLSPSTARSYGIIGDALAELGRYDAAFAAFDRMAALRPSLSSYARVAYARELLGRPRGAIAALELALDAAAAQPEPRAWTHVELGKLHWSVGNLPRARKHYRAALASFPGYVFALDALAHVEAARGRYGAATELARRAGETIALPQFVATLGDIYRVSGRNRLARRQYALVGAIERLLTANGVKTELETAAFNVDHGLRLRRSLALARRAHAERPSIEADDTLAWALARNGRCREALHYSRRALRLGTLDAQKFFHRGMVERCLGREQAARGWFARALRLNPNFSLLWAPVARRALS